MGWKILDSTGAEKTATGSGVSTPTKTILTASSGTYNTPVGCTAIYVECLGAGGGGGGATVNNSGQAASGGGGGGGAYSASMIMNPAASYSYAVGTGGTGSASGSGTATAGGDTSFGSTLVLAKGGSGGASITSSTTTYLIANGGAGGVAASGTGTVLVDGGGGGLGFGHIPTTGANPGAGGFGGAGAVLGASRAATGDVASAVTGSIGLAYGGGGSGGSRTASTGNNAGGNGANGVIIITEFYGTPTVTNTSAPTPTTTVLTSGSGTYTVPAGCQRIFVECIGGGGGGGGTPVVSSGQWATGGGGGGGGYTATNIVNPSATYSYSVGAGGTGTLGGTGNTGGNTTFGTLTANGGVGGQANGGSSALVAQGGAGGGASGGQINTTGEPGAMGVAPATNQIAGGAGGSSVKGGGGTATPNGLGGNAAANTGGGGGASGVTAGASGAQAGGTGGSGIIIITEYYSQPQQYIAASSSPKFTSQDMAAGPPANPVNGDIWYATAAGGSGEVWTFRYNANSVSAYKWEFVGGSPVYVSYDYPGGLSIGNSTFTAITGLSLTTVRAGDYIFAANGQIGSGAVGQPEAIMQLFVNGGAIAGAYFGFPELSGSTSAPLDPMAGHFKVLGASANDVYTLRAYSSSTGTNQVNFARLQVIPVRVA